MRLPVKAVLELVRAPSTLRVLAVFMIAIVLPSQLMTAAPLPTTLAIEDMTWMDVRDALANGYTTVIVPTGGLEQNGPHMIIGKHDYIVREAALKIAESVGHTLVAPVVAYVPEGTYDPPSGHLRFPGTMGVPPAVFDGVLEGIARSLKAGGFKSILFIGDHGDSQPLQKAVAERLSKEWAKAGVRVDHVAAYYEDGAQISRLLQEGRTRQEIGLHAGLIDTSELMSVHPRGVDLTNYRALTFPLQASGVNGDPRGANSELGERLLDMRVAAASAEIKAMSPTQ